MKTLIVFFLLFVALMAMGYWVVAGEILEQKEVGRGGK